MTEITVTATDIEAVWRPLRPEERTVVPGLSAQAWRHITGHPELPDVKARIDAGTITQDTVKDVMVWMIIRVLKNPYSAATIQGSIDDHSETVTLDKLIRSGELFISDDQMARLKPKPVPTYSMYNLPLGG